MLASSARLRATAWTGYPTNASPGLPKRWEVFFSDPATEPDPATWRTEIVQPYREA